MMFEIRTWFGHVRVGVDERGDRRGWRTRPGEKWPSPMEVEFGLDCSSNFGNTGSVWISW